MDIKDVMTENIASLQSAISTSMLRKSMSQDEQSVASLLQGMEKANAKTMEASVTPHLGGKIDVNV